MSEIPMIDLEAQHESIRADLDEVVRRVISSGSYILGEEVRIFEQEFADYCNASYAVGVASGTDALYLALASCGVSAGDEVIVPSHTAVATVSAIEMTGARPVFADIDLTRYTLDPQKVVSVITPRTRAIVPVHLYGLPADVSPILDAVHGKGIYVIEDAAQAHGAVYRGRKTGSWGHMSVFSFYPTKNLGALGDGGMIVTNDQALGEKAALLRQYGWRERYVSILRGWNSRLDELQAGILRVKLRWLDQWNIRRRELAGLYMELLRDSGFSLPVQPEDSEHVYHQFVIRHPKRDQLRDYLCQKGISTLVHYPVPVHLQPAYADLGYGKGSLPLSEMAAEQVVSLPLFPEMTEAQVRQVSQNVLNFKL